MQKKRKVRLKRVARSGVGPREWCWRILRVTGALILTCWAFGSFMDLMPLVAYGIFVPTALTCWILTRKSSRLRRLYKRQRAAEFRSWKQLPGIPDAEPAVEPEIAEADIYQVHGGHAAPAFVGTYTPASR